VCCNDIGSWDCACRHTTLQVSCGLGLTSAFCAFASVYKSGCRWYSHRLRMLRLSMYLVGERVSRRGRAYLEEGNFNECFQML
jgi:hypothetical protein